VVASGEVMISVNVGGGGGGDDGGGGGWRIRMVQLPVRVKVVEYQSVEKLEVSENRA